MLKCSEKAYAMCPTRHLCGNREETVFTEFSECAAFNKEVSDKPMTNADRIRCWNNHELAETIANFVSEIDNGDVKYSDDPNDWLEWLKQPAEDE